MLFFSMALIICIIVITCFGININVFYSYEKDEAPAFSPEDIIYDDSGEFKAEFDGYSLTMDQYISEINSFMTGDDRGVVNEK